MSIENKNALQEKERQADESVLQQFDNMSKFGPMMGLTRKERWTRAVALKLNPPKVISEILARYPSDIREIHISTFDRVL